MATHKKEQAKLVFATRKAELEHWLKFNEEKLRQAIADVRKYQYNVKHFQESIALLEDAKEFDELDF